MQLARGVLALLFCVSGLLGSWARAEEIEPGVTSSWGTPVPWENTKFDVYAMDFRYGSEPFLITDTRGGSEYAEKESYEIRALTVYRPRDKGGYLTGRPVILFVHGGAWIDGYRDAYDFVAKSLTGEMGWVTVVMDYRLTSNQVFLADEHCPTRAVCNQPENVVERTKAAWYADNLADVAAALGWVKDRIGQHGGDSDQIVLFGHSAGGHLAALLGAHPDYAEARPWVRGIISMSGAYLLEDLDMLVFGAAIDQTFPGGHRNNHAVLADASPSNHVAEGMDLPPLYLLSCEQELPSLQRQKAAFQAKLESLGLSIGEAYLAGYDHYTEMAALQGIHELPTEVVVGFVQDALGLEDTVGLYLPLVQTLR